MLQIRINSTPIQLQYNIQNAQLDLQTKAPVVNMETIPPQLEIHQPQGKLTMDSTPFYYSIGLKNISDFARDNTTLARQKFLDSLARTVEEGHRMAQITNPANAFAEIAAQANFSEPVEITWAPLAPPDIHYEASPAEINVIPGEVNYDVQPAEVNGNYRPGMVDIRVVQYPKVEISTVDIQV